MEVLASRIHGQPKVMLDVKETRDFTQYTSISSSKLRVMPYHDPLKENRGLAVFEHVIAEHNYIITVDVSRGVGGDYSAFTVFDTTSLPYKMVARYKNNEIKPIVLPNVIVDP